MFRNVANHHQHLRMSVGSVFSLSPDSGCAETGLTTSEYTAPLTR
jgi:hypothetical protein